MARLKRVAPIGVTLHIVQRGNNRQVCFCDEHDMKAYLSWLMEFSVKHQVEIHAWVLMTNHVHLLCTSRQAMGVSKMMQSLGRVYVRYFNQRYGRSGTLWEGRFKSCLVDSENYLLEVYRYIELNTVRAAMVNCPAEYSWSGYQCNAMGKQSALQTPHELYQRLGPTRELRQEAYRELFRTRIPQGFISDIRRCTNSGVAFAGEKFISEIESLKLGRVSARASGRPRSV
jgi:putative transposase